MVTKYVTAAGVVARPIRLYAQEAEPTLDNTYDLAIWVDTNDSNRVYLIYRRGYEDQVMVELT